MSTSAPYAEWFSGSRSNDLHINILKEDRQTNIFPSEIDIDILGVGIHENIQALRLGYWLLHYNTVVYVQRPVSGKLLSLETDSSSLITIVSIVFSILKIPSGPLAVSQTSYNPFTCTWWDILHSL